LIVLTKKKIARINHRLFAEVERTVSSELPACDDWTAVSINKKLLRIIAIVSGHIFLGPELCRREEYIHASINYTVDLFGAIGELKKWPKILRFVARYTIPHLKRVKTHRESAEKFLLPIIKERRKIKETGQELPDDMLQWMINESDERGIDNDPQLAFYQLTLSLAAIHTTSMTATNV